MNFKIVVENTQKTQKTVMIKLSNHIIFLFFTAIFKTNINLSFLDESNKCILS